MERSAGSTILGRLELIREETASVGVQVFGPTWAVLDHETGELARTCVLDAELLPDAASRAAFVAGLDALTSLRDPTLVPQLFVGTDDMGGAVLYEPLPGGVAFDDLFDGTGSYELTIEVGRLARQLARALAALHARGHVHGMLASPCVFVGPRGPAVYQYGLAPLCDRAVLMRRARAFGLINIAPEVLAGGDFTPVADLHAWAVTVAQFAAGLRGPAALEVVRGSDELPGVTPGLRAALQACLAVDPGARPRDGAELLRMIEASGRGEVSGMLARSDLSDTTEPEAPGSEVAGPAAVSPADEPAAAPAVAPAPVAPPAPLVAPPAPASPPAAPARPTARPTSGMSLPVTSFEEMLMSGDRARRPATIPPGAMTAAAVQDEPIVDGARAPSWSGKSASNLRRVHVLTDPVKRGGESSGVTPVRVEAPGDLLIGGTREEVEAASRATTVRLDSVGLNDAVRTAAASAEPAPPVPPAPPAPAPPPAAAPSSPPASPPPASRPSASLFATLPPTRDPNRAALRPPSVSLPAARPASTPLPAARPASVPEPSARPVSAAMPAADVPERTARRRSSAISTGSAEPRDWGTIPPVQDLIPQAQTLAPPTPPVVPAPVAETALAPRRGAPPMGVTVAVVLAVVVLLVLWLS